LTANDVGALVADDFVPSGGDESMRRRPKRCLIQNLIGQHYQSSRKIVHPFHHLVESQSGQRWP
jgi:hypothetical protein